VTGRASRRAYRLAYDGTEFRGFQRQPDVPTVSDAVLDALRELGVADDVPTGYAAAGRTDAGVSASVQTVAFDAPDWLTPAALNAELPAAVRAWAAADVPADFHATHDAAGREYTYYLHAPAAEVDRARAALDGLGGHHDFHNLTPDDRGTVRTLAGTVSASGDFLVMTVAAGGFPRHLVRRLVTVVERVATGDADVSLVDRVLDDEPLSGSAGIATAPPEPLVLTGVAYPGIEFAVDPDAAGTARAVFADRGAELAARTRVSQGIADDVGE
jgi:tRNA pseudouridine38-40 synthase